MRKLKSPMTKTAVVFAAIGRYGRILSGKFEFSVLDLFRISNFVFRISAQVVLLTVLLAIALVTTPVLAERPAAGQWPQFRGPDGRGASSSTKFPVRWTDQDYAWSVKLPGIGHSSPIIWDDYLVITSADPDDATRYILCFRASDGTQIWKRKFRSTTHLRFVPAWPRCDSTCKAA